MAYIYKATNKENGKFYIGKTNRPKLHMRISTHMYYANHKNSNLPFSNALRKYGRDGFCWEIIDECSKENIGEREIYWIDKLKPEYNVTLGGDGGRYGIPCPEHVKEAARQSRNKSVIDTRTGIVYESATVAAKELGMSRCSISRSCAKDINKSRPGRLPWFRYNDASFV